MFNQSRVAAMLPAQDLERAKTFYRDKFGLTPTQMPGGLLYQMASGTGFSVYLSGGKSAGSYTQLYIEVSDIDQAVKDLKAKGVTFEEYDTPMLKTVDGIAEIGGAQAARPEDAVGHLTSLLPP